MRHKTIVLAIVVVLLVHVAAARAQNNRSAVSISGSDSNTCTTLSPCRSIAYALTQTNPGGELIALTSGGYGSFSVNQSVTIEVAPGIYAGITATTGTAITINGAVSDTVVLRGLTVNSLGAATGIFSGGGARLYVEHCQIQGFTNAGILSSFDIVVLDTTIRNCFIGIEIDNTSAAVKATIDRVFIAGGGSTNGPHFGPHGVFAWHNSNVSVSHAVVADSYNGFSAHQGGILNLESCIATHTYTGVWAGPPDDLYDPNGIGGFVRASNVTTVGNWFGFYRDPRATLETWGNNRSFGNTGGNTYGTPTLVPLN